MSTENKAMQSRARLSNEEKLKLMTEYVQETGEKIKINTIYKGYNIGYMKNNLRQKYFNGELKIDEELLQKFIKIGIIVEDKEKTRTSYQEKYDFLMSLVGKTKEELLNSKMESGLSYIDIKHQMQIDYNRGRLKLNDSQIKELREAGFLGYSKNETKEISEMYEMPHKYAIDILKEYGTKEKFVEQYKRELCDYNFENKIFCGFRGIVVSNREITVSQKLNYASFVQEIIGKNIEIGYSTGKYIDVEKIDSRLKHLKENEQKVIRMHYGLDGKKYKFKEIEAELGLARGRSGQIENKVLEELKKLDISLIVQDNKKELEELNKYKIKHYKLNEMVNNINSIKSYITDEDGNQKKEIKDVKLEKLGNSNKFIIQELIDLFELKEKDRVPEISLEEILFSVRTYNCLQRAGVKTLYDITKYTENEIKNLKNLGEKSYKEILKKLKTLGVTLRNESEDENSSIDEKEINKKIIKVLQAENSLVTVLEQCDTIQDLIDKYNPKRKAKIPNLYLEELELSVRTYMCLRRAGVKTLYDIMNFTEVDLMKVRNLGRNSYDEVLKKIWSLGARLRYKHEDKNSFDVQKETDEQFIERLKKENIPLNLLEQCNKEIEKYELILEDIKKIKNEMEKKIKKYEKAVEKYLNQEDIFDAQFIII